MYKVLRTSRSKQFKLLKLASKMCKIVNPRYKQHKQQYTELTSELENLTENRLEGHILRSRAKID